MANCAHCFNSLKNEYPQFGGHFEVVHHTQFINELIAAGRLKLAEGKEGELRLSRSLLHRPIQRCLRRSARCSADGGRRHDRARPLTRQVVLLRRRRRASVHGRESRRAHQHQPAERGLDTPAKGIAVACPFCVTMFEDGVRALNVEETFQVETWPRSWPRRSIAGRRPELRGFNRFPD